MAGGDIWNQRKFWARDTLLLENVLNAQLLKTEIKQSTQPVAARKTTVRKRGVAPRLPPEEPAWSRAARLSAGPAPHPGSWPQVLSRVFPSFSQERSSQRNKEPFSKRSELQVAWSSPLGFLGATPSVTRAEPFGLKSP